MECSTYIFHGMDKESHRSNLRRLLKTFPLPVLRIYLCFSGQLVDDSSLQAVRERERVSCVQQKEKREVDYTKPQTPS